MGRRSQTEQIIQGETILSRLASEKVPRGLQPHVGVFKSSQRALVAANAKAAAAEASRDKALRTVNAADAALDKAVYGLANVIVGANLGSRQSPLKGRSPYVPSKLTALAYAREAEAVLALCAKLKKEKPPAEVAKAIANCQKLAVSVQTAIAALPKSQLVYAKALASRDELLPTWTKARGRLERNAAAVWFDTPATYRAIFAPPGAVQVGGLKKRKAAVKKTPPAPVKPTAGA